MAAFVTVLVCSNLIGPAKIAQIDLPLLGEFTSVLSYVVVALPPARFWQNQPAYEIAFGSTWRIARAPL